MKQIFARVKYIFHQYSVWRKCRGSVSRPDLREETIRKSGGQTQIQGRKDMIGILVSRGLLKKLKQ